MLTPYLPDISPDARFSLKDTAAILGLHPNTVRNYTYKGFIRVEYMPANGRPRYRGSEIIRFWKQSL